MLAVNEPLYTVDFFFFFVVMFLVVTAHNENLLFYHGTCLKV
jgi:hypothetical protein